MTPLEINKRIAELKGVQILPDLATRDSAVYELSSIKDDDGIECHIPYNWAEWLMHAWDLFEEMAEEAVLQKDQGRWLVFMNDGEIIDNVEATISICLAWIKWKEGENERSIES